MARMTVGAQPDASDPRPRSPTLDLARGGAAILVLLSHARTLVVGEADGRHALSLVEQAFFAVTGLGHQAVIVFFVISGLLVTRSILRDVAAEHWNIGSFALARLTRLWVVLLPCLALVAGLDRLGLAVSGVDPSRYGLVAHEATHALDLSWSTGAGNAVFLQTIAVPSFGSDGPLWSLANEAWYYAVAGLCCSAWLARGVPSRAAAVFSCALLAAFVLPRSIVQLAPVWAGGAALAVLLHRSPVVRRATRWQRASSVAAFSTCLLVSRLYRPQSELWLDYALGACTIWVLAVSDSAPPIHASRRFAGVVRWTARRSYSLYLIHCPILAFVAASLLGTSHLALGATAAITMAFSIGAALAGAELMWWCFERHTEMLRYRLSTALARFAPAPACRVAANPGIGQ